MSNEYTLRTTPCGGCPYRKEAPSGVWHQNEYEKLREYDSETFDQPAAVFLCHDADRDSVLCCGWAHVHGSDLLALRLLGERFLDWDKLGECSVELFSSGTEAAEHGIRDIEQPGEKAGRLQDKLLSKHPDLKCG